MRIIDISEDYYLMAGGNVESFARHLKYHLFCIEHLHHTLFFWREIDRSSRVITCVTSVGKENKNFLKNTNCVLFLPCSTIFTLSKHKMICR